MPHPGGYVMFFLTDRVSLGHDYTERRRPNSNQTVKAVSARDPNRSVQPPTTCTRASPFASVCQTGRPSQQVTRDGVPALVWERLDLSRFRAAPSARLSRLPFESDRAFPTQC
jgi:hypothetical protein